MAPKKEDGIAFAVWITGLPASGKSTIARALAEKLRNLGVKLAVLESDALRKTFSKNPSYTDQERDYFYGAMAFIGRALVECGVSVIFDATANRRSYRDQARRGILRFIEVYVETPLETCVQRDPKGIYARARQGLAASVPGLQSEYEPPENAEVVVRGDRDDPEVAANRVLDALAGLAYI